MSKVAAILLLIFTSHLLTSQAQDVCQDGTEQFSLQQYLTAQRLLWDCMYAKRGTQDTTFQLAMTYRSTRDYASGLVRANRLLLQEPESADLLFLSGYLYYRSGETKESMVAASKAYRIAPTDWRVHSLFALNYIAFNMLEPAKLSLLKAIDLKPDNAELEYQLARLYFTQGSYLLSIEASKKALDITPEYPEVYHNMALAYEGIANTEKAIQNFEIAVELGKRLKREDEWPLIDFADYERMLGHPELSERLLGNALQINPHSPKANYEEGELLADAHKYAEAKRYLETAVELDRCNTEALYGLATVTSRLGDHEQSRLYFKRFADLTHDKQQQHPGGLCSARSSSP